MIWTITKNNKPVSVFDIPVVDMDELRSAIIEQVQKGLRVIGFFGSKENSKIRLYVTLANDEKSELLLASAVFEEGSSYPSLTLEIPAFHVFEREFYEDFGIKPQGHPWLKPLRSHREYYPFFKMEGEEVHEVAVGPIHAGVIEPGHFRFMCNGEKVYNLEIKLGYQHRNVEKMFVENKGFSSTLSESIAGDTVIGHNTAYSNAMEALAGVEISKRAAFIRMIALEMERVAIHIGDLGAISNDIAYLMGNSVFGATRTLVVNTLLQVCGSRYGRGLIRVGGVVYDIDEKLSNKIISTLSKVLEDVDRMATTMFNNSSVVSRLEKTGVVNPQIAKELGLVGMVARASGVPLDVRIDYPCKGYEELTMCRQTIQTGDVYARAYIRYQEIVQSIQIIKELLAKLPSCKNESLLNEVGDLSSKSFVVSMIEGWRGEVVHTAITNENGDLARFKIKDPSFNNWYGLAFAVRDNGISDFPLCNKSFNLSYCGNDL